MFFKSLLSIHYIIWLLLSALFFAVGEFMSKKFALTPKISYILLIFLAYNLGTLAWLPAIFQKNQLSITGVLWTVLGLLVTFLMGFIIFKESLSLIGILGIIFAFVAVILLSLA